MIEDGGGARRLVARKCRAVTMEGPAMRNLGLTIVLGVLVTAGAADACVSDSECDDGDVCNGVETCQGGSCAAGTAPDCDDCNVCTVDSCHPITGCINVPNPGCDGCALAADCADGNPCTSKVCECGACVSTPLVNGTPCPPGPCASR